MRFFVFQEDCEYLPDIFRSPEEWAEWINETRGVSKEVTDEIVQFFKDPSHTEFHERMASFSWQEYALWFPCGG